MENKVIDCILSRRSCRSFVPGKVPEKELLDQVLEAGKAAPTGRGCQSPIIIEVTDKETRDRLSVLNASILGMDVDPFYGAPMVLAVLAEKSFHTYIYDGTLVMGNLLLAAHAVGLGACWIHRAKEIFDLPEGKKFLREWGVEGDYEGIGFCILGYPAEALHPAVPRKENYVYKV